ncbi:YggS family pyridoxal phosphate-dependent enzyme [Ornithinimicrobium ciconiae]|uniref:Pyridoxal phosphate homeostasis protein n=1 Tax=Ornithinimicrobium ciconiae TaxID=2594265 RepID=A0A516G9X6_9MICO|nr:YggS family pyridoxal phosphate-dependent enzyme [Ornithinimicrobium ciconiae]QDO88323.1 YggS family pyridoxal phosphate-dependent enzyme [Ornithinimicrobium ciconiae]
MSRREEIETNLAAVRERIARACADAGRDPGAVTLIVVTKFHPVSDLGHLVDLGVTDIGENRDQEAGAKIAELDPATRAALTVHFVGQLQTNKARHVVRYADVVQSVDRAKLVGALDRAVAARAEAPHEVVEGVAEPPQKLAVLLQVDLGEGEDAGRGGILPADLMALADQVELTEHLTLKGLMAVAPFGLGEAGTTAAFGRLTDLGARVRDTHPDATVLSAGMSGDLEIAIRSGATHLRVGTAILGSRPDPR